MTTDDKNNTQVIAGYSRRISNTVT